MTLALFNVLSSAYAVRRKSRDIGLRADYCVAASMPFGYFPFEHDAHEDDVGHDWTGELSTA